MKRTVTIITCLALATAAWGKPTKPLLVTARVVDSNAQPLAGAEVAVYEQSYDYATGENRTRLLGPIGKTDASGQFTLNAEICAQYRVFIVARKSELALGWDGLNYGSSDKAEGNFNVILETPSVLAGKVVDASDKPIAGAKVRAVPKTSYLSRLRQRPILAPEEWFTTQTGANGSFRFDNFAADVSTDLWVTVPGRASVYKYTTHWTSACGFEVGRTDVRLVLPKEEPVRGRVVEEETGSPVAGLDVVIRPENIRECVYPYRPHRNQSGPDGRFNFAGVPPGKHTLRVALPENEMADWIGNAATIDTSSGQGKEDVTIRVSKGGIIEITVRDAQTDQPIRGARVSIFSEDGAAVAWSDADGKAHFRMPTGQCNIYVSAEQYSDYRSDVAVEVEEGQTEKAEIALDPGSCVSGVVLDESGQPVRRAMVRLHPFGQEVFTDNAGKFKAKPSARRATEFLLARHVQQNLAAVVRVENQSEPMKVTLKPALSVVGKVADANGAGVPAARLSLCAHISNCLSDFGEEVLADRAGEYEIRAVPPVKEGFDYRLSVYAAGYGPETFKRVSITGKPGKSVRMDTLALERADRSISGVVVDAEGKPAATVPIFPHGTGQPQRTTATDENGRFTVTRICSGPIRLQANFDSEPGGSGSLEAHGGDQNVKIVLGERLFHTKQPPSLVGKALPELKALDIDLEQETLEDKIVLVCFWDMQQRPSRHFMRQLTEEAAELRKRGVVVAAIQASKIDARTLKAWVKKHDIGFHTGMIKDDADKTKFSWGVRSLPWLILTDRKHVVVAEGFGLHELDDRVSDIGALP